MIRYDVFPGLKRRCITMEFIAHSISEELLKKVFEKCKIKANICNEKEIFHDIHGIRCEWNQVKELFDTIKKDRCPSANKSIVHVCGNIDELNSEEWGKLEEVLMYISQQKNVWYTNREELKQYLEAQEKLIVSEDEEVFINSSEIDVWIQRFGNESFCIPAGRTIDMRRCK